MSQEQVVSNEQFSYRRYRQIEAELIPKLLDCAIEIWGEDAILEAWDEFHRGDFETEFSPDHPMNQAFLPYFIFFWYPNPEETESDIEGCEGMTAAEILLSDARGELSPEEIEILEAANGRPLLFFEILSVQPNEGYRVRNLFTDEEFELVERSGSTTVRVGGILLSAIFMVSGRWQVLGSGPLMLHETAKLSVLHLRDDLKKLARRKKLNDEILTACADIIRKLYLSLLNPPSPVLTNTDGDELVFQKVHFEVASAQIAFSALKGLTMSFMSEADLLAGATFKEGALAKVEIPWVKKGATELGGFTVLGKVRIDGCKLVVEVNSQQRAKKIREKIKRLLGARAKYKATVIESTEQQLDPAPLSLAGADSPELVSPELQARIKELSDTYWERWPDEPIPALGGKTPRKAMKTKDGRELLTALILHYEKTDNPGLGGTLWRTDWDALRKKLGLS